MSSDEEIDRLIAEGEVRVEGLRRGFRAAEAYQSFIEEFEEGTPHVERVILHSKGSCTVCDYEQFNPLHLMRKMMGLPYTDELDEDEALIPGYDRTRRDAERWGINRKGRTNDD